MYFNGIIIVVNLWYIVLVILEFFILYKVFLISVEMRLNVFGKIFEWVMFEWILWNFMEFSDVLEIKIVFIYCFEYFGEWIDGFYNCCIKKNDLVELFKFFLFIGIKGGFICLNIEICIGMNDEVVGISG